MLISISPSGKRNQVLLRHSYANSLPNLYLPRSRMCFKKTASSGLLFSYEYIRNACLTAAMFEVFLATHSCEPSLVVPLAYLHRGSWTKTQLRKPQTLNYVLFSTFAIDINQNLCIYTAFNQFLLLFLVTAPAVNLVLICTSLFLTQIEC